MEAFERLAEQRILEAMGRGEFDNLPGAGKPLILDDHPFVPDELWMAHKILRNAGCLPPEVEERKEISRLEDLLAGLQDDAERTQAQKRLAVLRMKVEMGRPRAAAIHIGWAYQERVVERLARTRRR
jgi:hypothetical protein